MYTYIYTCIMLYCTNITYLYTYIYILIHTYSYTVSDVNIETEKCSDKLVNYMVYLCIRWNQVQYTHPALCPTYLRNTIDFAPF